MSILTTCKRLSRPSQILLITCLLAIVTWMCWRVLSSIMQTNRLIQAVHRSDVVAIRRLLDSGADPNRIKFVPYWNRISLFWTEEITGPWTPLETAAYEGKTDIVKIMLDRGANINAQDATGQTPLLWALYKGQSDTIPLLLHSGADFSLCDNDVNTPLNDAASQGDLNMLALFIAYGADINAVRDGKTPLNAAVTSCRIDSTRFLLAHGARTNIKNDDGLTLLEYARQYVNNPNLDGIPRRKMKSIMILLAHAEAR